MINVTSGKYDRFVARVSLCELLVKEDCKPSLTHSTKSEIIYFNTYDIGGVGIRMFIIEKREIITSGF